MSQRRGRLHKFNPSGAASPIKTPLRISIATYPQVSEHGVTIAEDVRLLKPALLYADQVTLYSPSALLLMYSVRLAGLNDAERMAFLKQVYPQFEPDLAPLTLGLLAEYERLARRRRGRSREELLTYLQMRPHMEKLRQDTDRIWNDELVPLVERMVTDAGADQIGDAISAGLLKIDPIAETDETVGSEAFVSRFVAKVGEMLAGGVYPLFDDQTGTLVRHGLAEGVFTASPLGSERGKQVAVASELMGRLPAFPRATLDEILDIRIELQGPLVRFRAAMIDLAKLIESATYDEGFRAQVDEVCRLRVEPALLEIDEAVKANTYLCQLVGQSIGDTKALITGLLAFGVAQSVDLPQMLIPGAAIAGQAIVRAVWEQNTRSRQISEHSLYFLFRTEQLLGDS